MNDESKKVMLDIIKQLINKDHGTITALQLLVDLLIENGSLDKKLLLAKIDETVQIFERDNMDEKFSEALLSLGNYISPGRYQQGKAPDLLSLLENWDPSGSKH
jgi:hypothetical protein